MYKQGLGDKFDGTPLRKPYDLEPKTIEASRDGHEKTGENECQVVDVETTPEESTQVKLFRKSIQKCRENFVYMPPNTEELIEKHSGADNDPAEEEQPIREYPRTRNIVQFYVRSLYHNSYRSILM